jgi:hypothetical protein
LGLLCVSMKKRRGSWQVAHDTLPVSPTAPRELATFNAVEYRLSKKSLCPRLTARSSVTYLFVGSMGGSGSGENDLTTAHSLSEKLQASPSHGESHPPASDAAAASPTNAIGPTPARDDRNGSLVLRFDFMVHLTAIC